MRPFIAILLAPLALLGATAQGAEQPAIRGGGSATITGRVVDSADNVLPGATVEIEPGSGRVVTDREGRFVAPNLAPGQYKVKISYFGFKEEEKSVSLS